MTLAQKLNRPGPKRILSLDGGGLRGISTLIYLKKIEDILRVRLPESSRAAFRLCDYFDLIAGTSTGAIIAAGLSIGHSVDELIERYKTLGNRVFQRSPLRWLGILRAKYDSDRLIEELQKVFGDRKMNAPDFRCGLLIVCKRLDSSSVWPLNNNPNGRYFSPREGSQTIANGEYLLWQVVRASTAAPTYFEPEEIVVASTQGKKSVAGAFVDGGVSPHNNPALQALMYATLKGYNLNWTVGEHQLLVVSVGTGRAEATYKNSLLAAKDGLAALLSLRDDCQDLTELAMQWLCKPLTRRSIDREIGDMRSDVAKHPMATYVRYQLSLNAADVKLHLPELTSANISDLTEMDDPENMQQLETLAAKTLSQIEDSHFPAHFDVGGAVVIAAGLNRFRKRADVMAIQLSFKTEQLGAVLFNYQKWGAQQQAKPGDWLVQNDTNVYTVDAKSFAATYQETPTGRYKKITAVYAEQSAQAGVIHTREGDTNYLAGDWLVYNQADRQDGYAVSQARFAELYEPAE